MKQATWQSATCCLVVIRMEGSTSRCMLQEVTVRVGLRGFECCKPVHWNQLKPCKHPYS